MHKRREKKRNDRDANLETALEHLDGIFNSSVKNINFKLPSSSKNKPIKWESLPKALDPMSQLTKLTKQGRALRKRQQLQSLMNAINSVLKPGDLICDYGSGQGHLGLLIAYLYPTCRIIILDHNEEKLNMATLRINEIEEEIFNRSNNTNNNNDKNTKTTIKSFKERIELCNAMDDIKYRPIDLGVGLHCCGNFTDIAIKHCKEIKANFCISPCCYGQVDCTGANNNNIITDTNSIYWKSVIRGADFNIGDANLFNPLEDEKFKQTKKCMNFVDIVLRSQHLVGEKQYDYHITVQSLMPLSCSPKNNVIVGILNCKLYPDKYIFDDDKKLSYMFPNVKTFDEKKNNVLKSLLDNKLINDNFINNQQQNPNNNNNNNNNNMVSYQTPTPLYRLRCRFGFGKNKESTTTPTDLVHAKECICGCAPSGLPLSMFEMAKLRKQKREEDRKKIADYHNRQQNQQIDLLQMFTTGTTRQNNNNNKPKPSTKLSFSHYVFTKDGSKYYINDYPVAACAIDFLMKLVVKEIVNYPAIYNNIEAVNYLSSLHGDMLVTFIYSKPISSEEWKKDALYFQRKLSLKLTNFKNSKFVGLIGRSKGKCILLEDNRNYVNEQLHLNDGRILRYKQYEGSFSNPNGRVNEKCLDWLCQRVDIIINTNSIDGKICLLEMFCGGGNHTIALAGKFDKIYAVELDNNLCKAVLENCNRNNIHNVKIIQGKSEYFWNHDMHNNNNNNNNNETNDINYTNVIDSIYFNTILVDPPRKGLDGNTLNSCKCFNNILYISCSATSLERDLIILKETHEIVGIAFFDHFHRTNHIETAVHMRKIEKSL